MRYIKSGYAISNGNDDTLKLELEDENYLVPYYKLYYQKEYTRLPDKKFKFKATEIDGTMKVSASGVRSLLDSAIVREFLKNKEKHVKENLALNIRKCKSTTVEFGFLRNETVLFYRGGNERCRNENVFYSMESYPIQIRDKDEYERVNPERDFIFNALRFIGSVGISEIRICKFLVEKYNLDEEILKKYLNTFNKEIKLVII